MATVGRGADQYTVRFPDGLRDRVKAAADANNRSMNAEIVATLEEKYPVSDPTTEALGLIKRLSELALAARKAGAKEEAEEHAALAYLVGDAMLNNSLGVNLDEESRKGVSELSDVLVRLKGLVTPEVLERVQKDVEQGEK